MSKSNTKCHGQQGFTLIEIISVLVILGILAAVAVPRFFTLQAQAQARAVDAAAGEVQARVTQVFADRLLGRPAAGTTQAVAPLACADAAQITLAMIQDSAGTGTGTGVVGGWTVGSWAGTPAAGASFTPTFLNNSAGVTSATASSFAIRLPSCN